MSLLWKTSKHRSFGNFNSGIIQLKKKNSSLNLIHWLNMDSLVQDTVLRCSFYPSKG